MLDSWTITIKQNVRLQERMHPEKKIASIKFKMAAYWPLFTFTEPLFGNRTRWLDHYYKTKFEISGEDAS